MCCLYNRWVYIVTAIDNNETIFHNFWDAIKTDEVCTMFACSPFLRYVFDNAPMVPQWTVAPNCVAVKINICVGGKVYMPVYVDVSTWRDDNLQTHSYSLNWRAAFRSGINSLWGTPCNHDCVKCGGMNLKIFAYASSRVNILAERPGILTKIFHGFPQCLQRIFRDNNFTSQLLPSSSFTFSCYLFFIM